MNILTMMWKNLRRGYQTLLFPARPKVTPRFRGWCNSIPRSAPAAPSAASAAPPRAIEFKAGKGEFTWSYNPGQCTFCGRCVEGCTEHALKEGRTEHALSQQQEHVPPIYTIQARAEEVVHRGAQAALAQTGPADQPAAAPPARAAVPSTATGGAQ